MHLHHYALLVHSIDILLQNEITVAQVDAADEMLCDFYCLLPELHSEACFTYSSHLLNHLVKYVCLLGPFGINLTLKI